MDFLEYLFFLAFFPIFYFSLARDHTRCSAIFLEITCSQ